MKKILVVLTLIINLVGVSIAQENDSKFEPFYSFHFSEGGSVPSKGGTWFLSTNLTNDLGFIAKPFESHTLMGLYELKYNGPGFKRQEGRDFMERSMDHILVIQDQLALIDWLTLKGKLDYMYEFYRAGSNEDWGASKYDYNRYGGEVKMETKFLGLKESIGIQYHYMNFPNYVDLITQGSDTKATTEGGLQNNNHYSTIVSLEYGLNKLSLQYDIQTFDKQRVIQEDGTLGSEKQLDTITAINVEGVFGKVVMIAPTISLRLKRSNQNYLHFIVTSSTAVPTLVFPCPKFYDYNQYVFTTTLIWRMTPNNEIFITPEIELKYYTDRQPRDKNDIPIKDQKQYNILTVVTVGYSVKWNEVSRWYLYYNFFDQKSNMEYEGRIPYNYQGHAVGMRFTFAY